MNRLTTDNPKGNFETMMNFAYAEDGEVWIRGAGGDGESMRLNEYIYSVLLGRPDECGVENPDDVPNACGEGDCFCEMGALYAAATQAAELRARLAAYEESGLEPEDVMKYREIKISDDKKAGHIPPLYRIVHLIEADADGRLIELPCKVGDEVFILEYDEDGNPCCFSGYMFLTQVNGYVICTPHINDMQYATETLEYHAEQTLDNLGSELCVFNASSCCLTREEAETALEERQDYFKKWE